MTGFGSFYPFFRDLVVLIGDEISYFPSGPMQ
jgi:hypothetical protein